MLDKIETFHVDTPDYGALFQQGRESLLVALQRTPSTWYPDATWSPGVRVLYHAPHPLGALLGLGLCVAAMWRGDAAGARYDAPPQ